VENKFHLFHRLTKFHLQTQLPIVPRIKFQAAGDLVNHPGLDVIGLEAINTGLILQQNITEDIQVKLKKLKVIILL